MNVLEVVLWSTLGSVVSLTGGLVLIGWKKARAVMLKLALPFGAGALLAAAFFDLLPESLDGQDTQSILPWALIGFLTFFIIERSAGWFHHHHDHDHGDMHRDKAQSWLLIVGNFLHNSIDGVVIGVSFLAGAPTGVVTTLAIAAHEIPKELAEFGLLLAKHNSALRTLVVNIIGAILTVVFAAITFLAGNGDFLPVPQLLAVAAGFFIYIAASDIIPDIHERPHREANQQAVMLILGVVIVSFAIIIFDGMR